MIKDIMKNYMKKNWKLSFSTFDGGSFKYFWTAGGALKYLKHSIWDKCFVDLENERLGIIIRLHVPDEKDNWTLGLKIEETK